MVAAGRVTGNACSGAPNGGMGTEGDRGDGWPGARGMCVCIVARTLKRAEDPGVHGGGSNAGQAGSLLCPV